MGMRTVNDPYGDPSVLVDTVLRTSYDAVLSVANNIDYVKKVSNLFDTSDTIVSNLHQRYISAEGQSEFVLPVSVVSEALVTVFVNGKWKSPSTTFTAYGTTLFFNQALTQGDVVDAMIVSSETFDVLQKLKEDSQNIYDTFSLDFVQKSQELEAFMETTEQYKDKAQKWAEAPENTQVEPGQYSAKHHSIKANAQRVLTEQAANTVTTAVSTITFIGANVRKLNTEATRAPLPSDDGSQGYAVGSRWLWQGREWLLVDASAGAATWNEVTQYDVASLPVLLAYQRSYPLGSIITTRAEGFSYTVMPTGSTDYNIVTAGGSLLRVNGVGGVFNVKAFGAKGDNNTDDSAVFQAAVDAVGNGTLLVPPGTYRIHEIACTQGTMILCVDANGEVSTNANGTGGGKVRFVYNGTGGSNSFMFRWRAAVADNWLFGGGILGRPVMIGSLLCEMGIIASSTARQRFDIEMRNFTYAGIRLDSGNGVLSVSCSINLLFTYGANAAVENCHGVVMTGEVGNAGCTQHDIKTHGLIKHGDMVRMVGNCDNNRLTIHASKGGSQSGATGHALSFYDGATTHPRNNTIYDIAGPVYSSAGAFGNTIVRGTSESTKVSGPGQLHISHIVDYVNGKAYSTPTYPLFERREIPASQGVPFGGATLGVVAGVGAGVICADTAISGAVFTIPGGNWQKGKIRRVRIKYSCADATASLNIRFRVKIAVTPMGQGFLEDISIPLTAPGTAAGSAEVAEIVIVDASNLDMVPDALVSLSVERIGNDALDTATGNVRIHAVEVDYAAFGPENSYAAPVAYPDFKSVKA